MKAVEFESAQNVKIEFELASVAQRSVAALIDVVTFFIYFIICAMVIGIPNMIFASPGSQSFIYLLIVKLPFVFYNPVIEYLTHGQSLGKYILGIRVVTVSGERPGFREVFTRWMFKGDFIWISFDPMFFLIWVGMAVMGIVIAGTSQRRQRMGDSMANTLVIKNKSTVRYSLKDVLAIKNQDNYTPQYPNATRFTDEDMLLIKNTIQRVKANPNEETKKFAIQLADEAARLLGLEQTPEKRMQFLQTLLQDYVVLTR